MEFTFDAIRIVMLLLPGFVTQGIVTASSTRYPRSNLTYVLGAVGWAIVNYAILWLILVAVDRWSPWPVLSLISAMVTTPGQPIVTNLKWLIGVALFMFLISLGTGAIGARSANGYWFYKIAVKLKLTRLDSGDSVWLDMHRATATKVWVEVFMVDGKHIVGTVMNYSHEPGNREMLIYGREEGVLIESPDGTSETYHSVYLPDISKVELLAYHPPQSDIQEDELPAANQPQEVRNAEREKLDREN